MGLPGPAGTSACRRHLAVSQEACDPGPVLLPALLSLGELWASQKHHFLSCEMSGATEQALWNNPMWTTLSPHRLSYEYTCNSFELGAILSLKSVCP